MRSFVALTRRINRVFLALAGVLIAVILAAIAYDLVARHVFNAPTLWALDVSRFLLLFAFFLALGPTLQAGSHVSVDVVEQSLPRGPRRVVRMFALVLVLVFGTFLLWQVARATYEAFVDDSLFPIVIPLKLKHVYWIGPIGVLQFMLTAIAQLHETAVSGQLPPRAAH